MPRNAFLHVETWVFDLDDTLYRPEVRLFDQIEARMNAWVMESLGLDLPRATRLRRHYWELYGTTLAGLMAEHGTEPDAYLAAVHDIDLSAVAPDPDLAAAVAALPGRKIVFTNGSRAHARNVTAALGLGGVFDALYGFEDAGYTPKPREEAFARVFATDGLAPARAAMFEDAARNLAVPHGLGMRTVLVGPVTTAEPAGHVHHVTDDLVGFLALLP
jgi:putative hydrolase of the HAD superfamily